MKKEAGIVRKMEAFDYVQYSLRRFHNHQLNGCLHMEGHIDEQVLRQAVIASFEDLPQLACTFYKGVWVETEVPSDFSVEVRKGECGSEAVAEFFAKTVLVKEPFQIKILILRTQVRDTVCITMNHMLLDGMAFKQYLYLLCELYNEAFTENPPTVRYTACRRGLKWIRKRKVKRRPSGKKPVKEKLPIVGGSKPCFLVEKIPEDKLQRILTYVQKRKVTLNDYMMAAYYVAVFKVFGRPLRTLCCAADLRRYNKSDVGLCNQTGNMFCTIKGADTMSFEELVEEVHKQMEKEKDEGYCLKEIKRLNRVFTRFHPAIAKWLIDESVGNPKVAFTNLGIIDEEKLCFYGVETKDCVLTGSLKHAPNFQVSLCTYKGQATLSIQMLLDQREEIKLTYFLQVFYVALMDAVVEDEKTE